MDAASLVVKNETGIAQNSANRVGSLFENEASPSVSWNGDAGIVYRVSALINATASNAREFYFYIAKDGVIDETTKVSIHFKSTDPHTVCTELFASGAHYYEIWIEQKGTLSQVDFVNAQLNLMSV